MSKYADYGSVMAKVSVLKRSLLSSADYSELLSKHSVAQVCSYLKNETSYATALSDVTEDDIHRNELEERLNKAYTGDIVRLYNFVGNENKHFLTYLYIHSEIELLKIILRRLDYGDTTDISKLVPNEMKKHFSIDLDRLLKAENIKEFLEGVTGSKYEPILLPILKMKEHQNLLSIEMSLDMYYFSAVKKLEDGLRNKADKAIILKNVGTEIDMLNLLWIYRCKKFFKLANELIFSFLIPNKHRLKRETIMELVSVQDEESFLALVRQTPYSHIFNRKNEPLLEHNYYEYIYKMHKKMNKENPFSIEAIISYLHFKDIEMKNITSLTEGIRYGLDSSEIRPYLIGVC